MSRCRDLGRERHHGAWRYFGFGAKNLCPARGGFNERVHDSDDSDVFLEKEDVISDDTLAVHDLYPLNSVTTMYK